MPREKKNSEVWYQTPLDKETRRRLAAVSTLNNMQHGKLVEMLINSIPIREFKDGEVVLLNPWGGEAGAKDKDECEIAGPVIPPTEFEPAEPPPIMEEEPAD